MNYLRGTLFLSVASIVCCKNFISVLTSCRYWDVLDTYSNTGDQHFHCILDQDKVPGIVYTEWTTIPSGYCPIYNRHAKRIDSRTCNNSIGECPSTLIRSYQGITYTGCFQMPLAKPSLKNTEKNTDDPESEKKDTHSASVKWENSININIIFMALAIAVTSVALGISIGYCYKRHNRRHEPTGCDDSEQHLINTKTHTSERETTPDSSLNNVYHRINRKHFSEKWANTAISRSISDSNLAATRCAL